MHQDEQSYATVDYYCVKKYWCLRQIQEICCSGSTGHKTFNKFGGWTVWFRQGASQKKWIQQKKWRSLEVIVV